MQRMRTPEEMARPQWELDKMDRDNFDPAVQKISAYLTQENSVLHERVRKLEIELKKKASSPMTDGAAAEFKDEATKAKFLTYVKAGIDHAIKAEREACAKVAEDLASNTGQLLLHAGEMEAQELRTAKAVIKLVASLIRGRGET